MYNTTKIKIPQHHFEENSINVLQNSLEETIEQDLRQRPEVLEAIEYLKRTHYKNAAQIFQRGLEEKNPCMRYEALCNALKLIERSSNINL